MLFRDYDTFNLNYVYALLKEQDLLYNVMVRGDVSLQKINL